MRWRSAAGLLPRFLLAHALAKPLLAAMKGRIFRTGHPKRCVSACALIIIYGALMLKFYVEGGKILSFVKMGGGEGAERPPSRSALRCSRGCACRAGW